MELKVNVPTTLSEITLEQYQRFVKLEGDEEFLTHKMLEIFCGLPLADLPNVRVKDVSNVTSHIYKMLNEKPKLKPTFTIGKQEFGFIPEIDNITYGEFIDLDTYIQDIQNLHNTMAVLYRPITKQVGERYLIEPYESASKYAELMKQAPMDVVMGAVLFFYRLGNELLQATMNYLEENKTTSSAANRSLTNDGDGMRHSISLLKEMLEGYPKYQNLNFTSAFSSSPLKSKSKKLKTTS